MTRRKDRLRKQGRVYGPLCDFVRGRTCCVPDCQRQGQPHHDKAIGMGGSVEDWLPVVVREGRVIQFLGIISNVAPLCAIHHAQLHTSGASAALRERITVAARKMGVLFAKKHPEEYARLDELYAGVALRAPELCFPADLPGIDAA